MKYCYILFFIFCFFINSYSQIIYDTTVTSNVGPGIKYYQLKNYSIPWSINIIEADLTNKYISIETVKGGDKIDSLERASFMAKRNNYEGHKVIAAVNADFWRNSIPIGMQISNNEFVKTDGIYSRIYFSGSNKPFIEKISFSGSLLANGSAINIDGVNSPRGANDFILYNKYNGPSTETDQLGLEAVISPLGGWIVNDTMYFKVESIAEKGNAKIPAGKMVLSGCGLAEEFIRNNIISGAIVKVILRTGLSGINIKELTGGYPRLVDKGINCAPETMKEEGSPSGATRHPRTAAGFSEDSTKLFLITVDGRQPSSAGMTIMELADFMAQSGVYYGINLDGGGSTTMVVRDSIVNSPSDKGGERRVCNSLQIISSDKGGPLKKIELNPKSIRLFRNKTYQYNITGRDEYGNPIPIDAGEAEYSLSSITGQIDPLGIFTAGVTADTVYIFVNYNGLKDSAKVITKTATGICLSPQNIITNTAEPAAFSVYERDMDSLFYMGANEKYNWKVSDETIGYIDQLGNFEGKKDGTVKVIASNGIFSDTSDIKVQVIEGKEIIKEFEDIDGLDISGTNMDSLNLYIERKNGANMLCAYYQYTVDTLKFNSLSISFTENAISGTPDAINMPFQTSTHDSADISINITDDNKELFQITGTSSNGTASFSFENKKAKQTNSKFFYPASLKQMIIKFGKNKVHGKKITGYYNIGNMSAIYKD